jgi:hypothetical protein
MKTEFIIGKKYKSKRSGNVVEFIKWESSTAFIGRLIESPRENGKIGEITGGWGIVYFEQIQEVNEPEINVIL